MGKKVIQRLSLTEQIKSILLDRIVEGTLKPGDRLKELQIADEFGTSQAPAREAIRSLHALGYVEHIPHVGALIKSFNQKEVEEAHQVREALEGYCLIRASIERDKLVSELSKHTDTMHKAMTEGDIKTFTTADNLFHRTIVEFSGNNNMLEIWDSLHMQSQVIAAIVETSIPLEKVYALHPPIIAALHRNDRANAGRALTEHYRQIATYRNSAG